MADTIQGTSPDEVDVGIKRAYKKRHESRKASQISTSSVSVNISMDESGTHREVPPVVYGNNFELRDHSRKNPAHARDNANGSAGGQVVDLKRVPQARVQKNTLPRSYLPPTIPSSSPFMTPRQSISGDVPNGHVHAPTVPITKFEVENALRLSRIRRWWRCVLLVILATLVFVLILIVVLVLTIR